LRRTSWKRAFFAPAGGVAAADSPTGADIPVASPIAASPAVVSIVPKEAAERTSKTISPAEALGLPASPRAQLDAMAKATQAANAKTNTPLPKKKKEVPPVIPPVIPPVKADDKAPVIPPVKADDKAPVIPPVVPPVPKIKVGEKEYTQDELTAYMAELEKKAAAPDEPAKEPAKGPDGQPVKPVEQDPVKQLTTAERDAKFIADKLVGFKLEDYGVKLSDVEFDTILSGGAEGVKAFTEVLARVAIAAELNARKWTEATMNPILSDLAPIMNSHQQIAQYQREAGFFGVHKDLIPYKDAVRKLSQDLARQDPQAVAAMKQEDFDKAVADAVRENVKRFGGRLEIPSASPEVKAPVESKPPKVVAKPSTGQLSSGNPAPTKVDQQKSMALSMRDF
jgi:hypothetical protein